MVRACYLVADSDMKIAPSGRCENELTGTVWLMRGLCDGHAGRGTDVAEEAYQACWLDALRNVRGFGI